MIDWQTMRDNIAEVGTAAMRRDIDMSHGMVMSEGVMRGLGPSVGREYAPDRIDDICRRAVR